MSDVAAAIDGLDAALRSIRAFFHATGAGEVLTPVVCSEVAIEPFIEPARSGRGFLRTSPELEMKALLAAGAGDIFQIAPVSRQDERGRWHRPQFHLIEWYRHTPSLDRVLEDVEALVASLCTTARAPVQRISMVDRLGADLGVALRGDEPASALAPVLAGLRQQAGLAPGAAAGVVGKDEGAQTRETQEDAAAAQLAAWTELHSLWADQKFEPWLATLGPSTVHLCEFPAPLAALSRSDGQRAARFETYVNGVELANGYFELADPVEQRRRFSVVNALRRSYGLAQLPLPEGFLGVLERPGLPTCCGAAMGLERLIALSQGSEGLCDVLPESIP